MRKHLALISVSDKRGLVDLARGLIGHGIEIVASGGTASVLQASSVPVLPVHDLTGSPEILGGRVKTLHPAVHGGILSRRTAEDHEQLLSLGWAEIDLVTVNLYPFEATVMAGATQEEAIEQIDIGGVALLRAAAKNFEHVTVICDPDDYQMVLDEFAAHGEVLPETRRRLAIKAFAHTAAYDAMIWSYLHGEGLSLVHGMPEHLPLTLHKVMDLRYGENPHQQAALYTQTEGVGPLGGQLLQGKPLSYNNLLDLDAAWRTVQSFTRPTVAVIKHLSPCGVASAENLTTAFPLAWAGDPVSAFGSVVGANRLFDGDTARALGRKFIEAIIAPDFTAEALEVLKRRKNCRLVKVTQTVSDVLEMRSVRGGVLVQARDYGDDAEWQVVTKRAPTEDEMAALRFAWRAIPHVRSNAILFAKGEAAVGVGGGQPSRVDAVKIAAGKAGDRAQGAVMASDAFFPFPDGVEVAAEAGVTAVIEPGGSIRDQLVIDAADQLGLAMVFTGHRHFRH